MPPGISGFAALVPLLLLALADLGAASLFAVPIFSCVFADALVFPVRGAGKSLWPDNAEKTLKVLACRFPIVALV